MSNLEKKSEIVQQLVTVRKYANSKSCALPIPQQVQRELGIKKGMEAFVSIVHNITGTVSIVYEFKRVG